MNEDRWKQIESMVQQALELSPEDRTTFIEKNCDSDETLRNEIQSLLEHGEKAFTFIHHFKENVVEESIRKMARNHFDESRMIGSTVGHYHITNILGSGGMGVVYKAKDKDLDRTVALKFLPPHLTQSKKDKLRFIREAKAAAALNHSNICTIYSVEQHAGQHFISMEYIDGQTLRQKLESEEISPKTALTYAIQITEALAEAHEKGIVHRDIKPGNIMVDSKNRIKVMDFGLAKLVDSAPITQTGTTLGTMAYMSPEQIQGRPVDHRADLFSFGVLLFEMLAGQRPFGGQYEAALSYSIVNEAPPLLSEFLPNAPQKLSLLISRLLEKDPAKRYSNSEQLVKDLQTCLDLLPNSLETSHVAQSTMNRSKPKSSSVSDSTSITLNLPALRTRNGILSLAAVIIVLALIGYWLLPSSASKLSPTNNKIAVLPLESVSTEPEDIEFTDGIHEELINRLAGIGDLTVIARRSVLRFPPEEREDLQSIGEQLGVTTLMDGTVRRIGDQLRVSVQLIDANSLATLWSGSFDENIDNVFEIQSRIALQVANELHASLTEEEQERLEERPTDNPQAYRLYMLGREYLSRTVSLELVENTQAAEQLFIRSLELDPELAQAWGMLAYTYSWLYWFHGRKSEDLQKMKEAAEWALFYGPNLAETYLANGVHLFWTSFNQEQTLAHFQAALERYPNHPLLHQMTAYTHRSLGNWKTMIEHFEKTLLLDPLNSNIHTELAYDYWMMRNYDKAETYIDRLIEFKPNEISTFTLWYKANIVLSRDGTLDGFEFWWDQIRPLDPAIEYPLWWGEYNTLKGDWKEALRGYRNIENEVAWQFELEYVLRQYLIAKTFDFEGNRAEALQIFEQTREELETLRDKNPEMARYRVSLAKVYSRMGEYEKAIIEAEIASKMLDSHRQDAENYPIVERHLAEIYAWCGREDLAIDKLEFALSVPSPTHRNILRIDPIWDPLRDNPRFQELIAGEDKPYIEGL